MTLERARLCLLPRPPGWWRFTSLSTVPMIPSLRFTVPALASLFLLPVAIVAAPTGEAWRPLIEGEQLAGWHAIGTGTWTVENGALHGTHVKGERGFGHLVSNEAYGDFSVRFKFKSVKGNSGFYFRSEETGFTGISGLQAEIDPEKDVGGLYETNGRNWVSQPTAAAVADSFKPGEWNDMMIEATGRNATVYVNGKKTAEIRNDAIRTTGIFALQLHGKQEGDVWFKDIEIQGAPVKETGPQAPKHDHLGYSFPGPYTPAPGAGTIAHTEKVGITAGNYSKVMLELDVTVGPWYAPNPDGWHNLFWLVKNGRNIDMVGYAALRQPATGSSQVMLRQGIGVPHGKKTKSIKDIAIEAGATYHLSYAYDVAQHAAALSITRDGTECAHLDAVPLLNPEAAFLTFAPGDKLHVGLSTAIGENDSAAAESPSIGWTYRNLRLTLVPATPAAAP